MDHYTDMDAFDAETTAFLTKVGQVVAKPTKSKKDEE
jgi:hypothetical protein